MARKQRQWDLELSSEGTQGREVRSEGCLEANDVVLLLPQQVAQARNVKSPQTQLLLSLPTPVIKIGFHTCQFYLQKSL